MRVWRLRDTREVHLWDSPEEDGHYYFRKDKMSSSVGVIYLTEDAAKRALRSVYRPEQYEIVPFSLVQIVEDTDSQGGLT